MLSDAGRHYWCRIIIMYQIVIFWCQNVAKIFEAEMSRTREKIAKSWLIKKLTLIVHQVLKVQQIATLIHLVQLKAHFGRLKRKDQRSFSKIKDRCRLGVRLLGPTAHNHVVGVQHFPFKVQELHGPEHLVHDVIWKILN